VVFVLSMPEGGDKKDNKVQLGTTRGELSPVASSYPQVYPRQQRVVWRRRVGELMQAFRCNAYSTIHCTALCAVDATLL
jgi:hypothetical protein